MSSNMTQSYLRRQGKPDLGYHKIEGHGPTVVFLGGFMSDMEGTKALALDAHCRSVGAPYVRFDYTGCGTTSGVFHACSMATWADDALDVLDNLTDGPLVVVGSSMGGWLAVLMALARPERIQGLVGVAAAPDFTERLMWAQMPAEYKQLLGTPGAVLELPSAYSETPYSVSHALIEGSRSCLVLEGEQLEFQMPTRFFHGIADPDVPWALSLEIVQKNTNPDCRLTLIKDGDHTLSRPQDLGLIMRAVEELRNLV